MDLKGVKPSKGFVDRTGIPYVPGNDMLFQSMYDKLSPEARKEVDKDPDGWFRRLMGIAGYGADSVDESDYWGVTPMQLTPLHQLINPRRPRRFEK